MEQDKFDEASNHPRECQCSMCLEWLNEVGPEPEGNFDDSEDDEIAF